MAERIQTEKPRDHSEQHGTSAEEAQRMQESDTKRQKAAKVAGQVINEELDALLDEIDEVLEEDAQAFVSQYIQKGGEGMLMLPVVFSRNVWTMLGISSILVSIWILQKHGSRLKTILAIGYRRAVEFGQKSVSGLLVQAVKPNE